MYGSGTSKGDLQQTGKPEATAASTGRVLTRPGFCTPRAAAKHYAEARPNNANELVRELSADPGMGFGLGKNPQQLETETMSALRAAATTLQKKAPDDADAYKQFVLEVARSVAEAAKGTSAAESTEIEKIRSALA